MESEYTGVCYLSLRWQADLEEAMQNEQIEQMRRRAVGEQDPVRRRDDSGIAGMAAYEPPPPEPAMMSPVS